MIYVCLCVGVNMCIEARGQHWLLSFITVYFLRQGLSEPWAHHQFSQLMNSRNLPISALPLSAGVTDVWHHAQLLPGYQGSELRS